MTDEDSEKTPEEGTLAHHLEHLAMTADDVIAFVTRAHEEGEIHPDALVKSEKLASSLREVTRTLLHHPQLAASSDDVWKMLSVKHRQTDGGTIT